MSLILAFFNKITTKKRTNQELGFTSCDKNGDAFNSQAPVVKGTQATTYTSESRKNNAQAEP